MLKRDELIADYADSIIAGMDAIAITNLLHELLTDEFSQYTDEILLDEVRDFYPELLETPRYA